MTKDNQKKSNNIVQFKASLHKNFNRDKIYKEKVKQYKFALDKQVMVSENGVRSDYWFIALKDRKSNVTLELTPYSKFLRYSIKSIDTRKSETIRINGTFICLFLNYVFIDKYDEFKIYDITEITVDHGNRFLKAYADGKIGNKEKKLDTIISAVDKLTKFYSDVKDLYKNKAKHIYKLKLKYKTNDGKIKYNTPFKIHTQANNDRTIFRDMPEEIFWKLLELSKIYYPELTFAIALQAFAGLRPGEVCNVRQAICPRNNGGIKYRKKGDKLIFFEINLSEKYTMRSDLKDVGGIKKKRRQKVYDKYLNITKELYENHIQILKSYKFESKYYPMFVNQSGQALTVSSYRDKMSRLVNKYLKEYLLLSDNKYFRFYGQLLTQYTLSPHFLRHWFTVRLVLDNLPPHVIAEWRGDSNINTALKYCVNKEELRKAIFKSNTKIVNEIQNAYLGEVRR